MNTVDCREMSCPAPVLTVKKALEEQAELRVLLDEGAPRENVARFARNRGYRVTEEREGADWAITITAGDPSPMTSTTADAAERVVLITSDRIGDGPEELGKLLMKNFLHTLLETRSLPSRILLMNSGVFLPCRGSDAFEALEKLHGMGVEILSCGLCLDFFKLKEMSRIGGTTNMLAIAENLLSAPQVVKL